MGTRLLPFQQYQVFEKLGDICLDPSSAQFHLWLKQMQRDHNMISDKEMSKAEGAVNPMASKSITIFNPFTGEIRRVKS